MGRASIERGICVMSGSSVVSASELLPGENVGLRPPVPQVLFVIDQLRQLGGAERMLLETAKRLDPRRYGASIVTFDLNQELPVLRDFPVPVELIPLRKTFHWQAIQPAGQLRRLLRDRGITILHSFFETSDLWASPIAKLCGCPVILSSRRDMGILRTRKHRLAYPIVNRVFDRVLTVSEQVRSFALKQEGLAPDQVETLYNGVDLEELDALALAYPAREQLQLPLAGPLITLVANIRKVKGIDILLRAAALVVRQAPQARFVIAGSVLEQDTMAALQSLVAELNLATKVTFLGQLPNPYPLLAASNIFVLPSRNEGFSNALIEAMACELPCIATRVGGNAEAIEEGRSGFLVNSEDHEALADRILRLIENPDYSRRMGSYARRAVRTRFSLDASVQRLMNIYDELLEAHNA